MAFLPRLRGRRRRSRRRGGCIAIGVALFLAACSERAPTATFHATGFPERISDWGILSTQGGVLELADDAVPYDLATPLFSDYALKLRTITLPKGEPAIYRDGGAFDLPVGSIISKTFYYPTAGAPSEVTYGDEPSAVDGKMALRGVRLVETRILAHRAEGWIALPYVWNDRQSEATLRRAGEIVPLILNRPDGRKEAFNYLVPNTNQCAGCHAVNATTRAIEPIGIKARHLNRPSTFAPGFNQLDHWRIKKMLVYKAPAAAPRNAVWGDESFSVEARARAYLDVNCSHCHSDVGPADTSGLDLRPSVPLGPKLGLCKTPIAAGGGSGGRPFDITPGEPDRSITLFRMETTDPGAMMPELGRAVIHEEGVALIRQWIAGMEGGCS